ncbi:hypothetical protein BGW38_008772 [Lunasporangiospora selenospora]|uniref:Uncharacterized protein n=1 Tax=Lunasporangiospora selenospora TaxID=979761 RepID=A0A9P6FJ56_9FUNG|nr:hypothetical protein BGW38_008772 [Lunasporangiospora selenospora]
MMVQHDPTRPSPPNTYHSLSYTPDSSDHNRPSVEGMLHHASYSGSLAPSTTHYIGPGDIDPRIGSFYGSGIVSGSGEFSGRQSVVSDSTVASSLFSPPVNPKMGGSSVLHPIQEQPHAPFMLPNASSAGYSPAGSHSSANRLRYSDSHSTSQPSHFSSGGVPYYLNSGGTYYPPGSAPAPDQYHDDGGYGSNSSSSSKQYLYLSNQSLFSDGVTSVGNPQAYSHRLETELSPPTVPKRPLSGPQGGLGFGTMLMMGNDGNVPPGNPHTLPQHQSSFHAESQSPPPLSPGLERG